MWDGGEPETLCGVGSTLQATVSIRAWLPDALARLSVKTLLDAPCGDRNWIREVDLPCDYIAADHEWHFVERASEGCAFHLLDICNDELPACDAILSRDFFQHLSRADERKALANMRRTGARWIIATCHGREGDDIETGGFRYVDWRARFGEPVDSAPDGKFGRILGVWPL